MMAISIARSFRVFGIGRTTRQFSLMAAFVTLLAPSAHAESLVYECRAKQRNYATEFWSAFDNLIQPDIRFTVDGDSVTVDDALVRSVHGGPMQAELSENTDGKFVARWQLVASGFGGRQATMSFRAAFLKKRSELIVTQAVMGSTTTFHARGNCISLSAR